MRRLIVAGLFAAVIGFVGFYVLTMPDTMAASSLPDHTPDPANGRTMFFAGGCASCHVTAGSKDKMQLGGGHALKTPFGTFHAPNISPDPDAGIGGWTPLQFVNAMARGISPDGSHYYPAFPYTSYQRMRVEDLLDLKAFMDTLPAVKTSAPGHVLPLPFRLRRGLGLWKLLYLDTKPFASDPAATDVVNRGAYLVEGPGHCGECHTPRNPIGGRDEARKLAGGPAPEGDGYIPNITPHKTGLGSWSAGDIAYSLKEGFTPEYDSFGGSMVAVQENMAKLSDDDRAAIAAYLKSVPAIESAKRPAKKPEKKPDTQ